MAISWQQWEIVVCSKLGLKRSGHRGVAEPDCEVCQEVGSLVVDAKRRYLPDWLFTWHEKTCSYARHDQLPMTVFFGGSHGPDLVVMRFDDFIRFCLPMLEEREKRGWW